MVRDAIEELIMSMHMQPAALAANATPTERTLASRAMQARLSITLWSASKRDAQITNEVIESHNAKKDAGNFNKRLVSKDALDNLRKIAREAREEHAKHTLPWQDDGVRILCSAGYLEYADKLSALKQKFNEAADAFADGYLDFVQDARSRLNGMFNESDYPRAEDIRTRFSFETKIDPLPVASDFRVALGDAQAAQIRADIEERTNKAIADAMRDAWQRVADHVGHMADRLKAYKPASAAGEKPEGVFRDTLVTNVRELTHLLASLNVTEDPALTEVAERMKALCQHDAGELRESDNARAKIAAEAEAILQSVTEYLA
jgi:hypothetical protein